MKKLALLALAAITIGGASLVGQCQTCPSACPTCPGGNGQFGPYNQQWGYGSDEGYYNGPQGQYRDQYRREGMRRPYRPYGQEQYGNRDWNANNRMDNRMDNRMAPRQDRMDNRQDWNANRGDRMMDQRQYGPGANGPGMSSDKETNDFYTSLSDDNKRKFDQLDPMRKNDAFSMYKDQNMGADKSVEVQYNLMTKGR